MNTTVRDIYTFIDSIAPFDTQESWDNSGFLVGDVSKEVKKVAVCLDVTHDTLAQAADFGADLLVSHHPVIFHAMKGMREQTPGTESIVYDAVRRDIAVLSAHTCWDLAEGGVNDVLATLVGLEDIEGIVPDENGNCMVRKGTLKTAVPAEEYAEIVSEALGTLVRMTLPEKMVRTVAVCGGAGASFLPDLANEDIDAYITGDAKHNDFLDSIDYDISLLAAGHYETETVSMPVLLELLKQEFSDLEYKYLKSSPVVYIG
ncbi:MAG: Nif3-like dinuclear metal center hexameric protein [Clostridia bacterium]|nr:Nif3-like dinuclear metal center hexameric protein [Clostridia bacterium]MBQ6525972.1 Nif3-like dinuclear metal center hexameric protein [Clostridia bacterium]